jgi:hypothetical protein
MIEEHSVYFLINLAAYTPAFVPLVPHITDTISSVIYSAVGIETG